MKKILIIVGILAIIFGSTFFIHKNNVENAKNEIEVIEKEKRSFLETEKKKVFNELKSRDEEFAKVFNEVYSTEDAVLIRDTNINLFVYSEVLLITYYDPTYINCVANFSENKIINTRLENHKNALLDSIHNKHGEKSNTWIYKMKNESERFLDKTENENCQWFFPNDYRYSLKTKSFTELDEFLLKIEDHKTKNVLLGIQNGKDFNTNLNKARRSLNSEGKQIFDEKMNTESYTIDQNYSYHGNSLGEIKYNLPQEKYREDLLVKTLEFAESEQYRNNSLYNGAMPYSYCYGSTNYGNSSVRVNAGSGDVLVMIKNSNDVVVRHAYIKANRSYTLNVSNGNYYVYFYYGKGWNPTKFMKNTTCGTLKGGFHSNEIVQKDPSLLRVNNQIMTYTLTEQLNGNFSTSSSNKMEAF